MAQLGISEVWSIHCGPCPLDPKIGHSSAISMPALCKSGLAPQTGRKPLADFVTAGATKITQEALGIECDHNFSRNSVAFDAPALGGSGADAGAAAKQSHECLIGAIRRQAHMQQSGKPWFSARKCVPFW